MRKVLFLVAIFLAVFALFRQAEAIIFIPPVIYIVTVSFSSFIANISISIVFWLVVKGIADRSYFGRPLHEIINFIFNFLGKIFILVFSTLSPIFILDPINAKEIFFSSLISGVLSLAILFLAGFREYRLIQKNEKISFLKSIAIFSAITVLLTFFSAFFALEEKALNMTNGIEYKEEPLLGFPQKAGEEVSYKEDYSGVKESLWFYSLDISLCQVYFENDLILTAIPSRNCYYYNENNQKERIPCPVLLKISDIPEYLIETRKEGDIYGKGSCVGNYSVILSENGFNVGK